MFVRQRGALSLFVTPSLLARSGLKFVALVASFNKQWSGETIHEKARNAAARPLAGNRC